MTTFSEGIPSTDASFFNPMTESQTLTNGRYANWSLTFLGGMAIVSVIACVALMVLALYEMLPMNLLLGFSGALGVHYFVVIEEVFNYKEAIELWRTEYQGLKVQSAINNVAWNSDRLELERLRDKYQFQENLDGLDEMESDGSSGYLTPTVKGSNNSTPLTATPVKTATPLTIKSQHFSALQKEK
jgi:hypothetical protein